METSKNEITDKDFLVAAITDAVLGSNRMLSWGADLRDQIGNLEARILAIEKYVRAIKQAIHNIGVEDTVSISSVGARIEKAESAEEDRVRKAVERLRAVEKSLSPENKKCDCKKCAP